MFGSKAPAMRPPGRLRQKHQPPLAPAARSCQRARLEPSAAEATLCHAALKCALGVLQDCVLQKCVLQNAVCMGRPAAPHHCSPPARPPARAPGASARPGPPACPPAHMAAARPALQVDTDTLICKWRPCV
eukprot:185790-Chlamydomonas_euryale.AAC.1